MTTLVNPNPHGGGPFRPPPSEYCISPKKLCYKMLLNLPDFSYLGFICEIKKIQIILMLGPFLKNPKLVGNTDIPPS